MNNEEYNLFVKNKDWEKLQNIRITSDLIEYQYNGRFLIEYLLEQGIHSLDMDRMASYNQPMATFYLKYNILEPLFDSTLPIFLAKVDGKTFLEIFLDKLNNNDKMKLYHNLRKNNYWLFHENEGLIIDIYRKKGIKLPSMFIRKKFIFEDKNNSKSDDLIIEEFKEAFNEEDELVIKTIVSELKKSLLVNRSRTIRDIRKLLLYKRDNPDFSFSLSDNSEGSYSKIDKSLKISQYREGVFNHEFSHFLFEQLEYNKDSGLINDYEEIRKKIDNIETQKVIALYLNNLHAKMEERKKFYENEYNQKVKDKYKSIDNYIKIICQDYINIKVSMVLLATSDSSTLGFFIDDKNISDVVLEFLRVEKEEYINMAVKNEFSYELILENLLDALLMGKPFDSLLSCKCMSGHGYIYFLGACEASFNECLANYDAIKKSSKRYLIEDLRKIVGNELISFLDDYIEKNREDSYGR